MLLRHEKQGKIIRRSFALDESVSVELDLYAKILGSSTSWVVNQALAYIFSKDKEYRTWKKAHADEAATTTQSPRKPRSKKVHPPEEPQKK